MAYFNIFVEKLKKTPKAVAVVLVVVCRTKHYFGAVWLLKKLHQTPVTRTQDKIIIQR